MMRDYIYGREVMGYNRYLAVGSVAVGEEAFKLEKDFCRRSVQNESQNNRIKKNFIFS